mgnify:CR=1 FL=1
MNIGFISRKIGLGDIDSLKNYSSLENLISKEVEKPIDFVGAETIWGPVKPWPDKLSFTLEERIERLVARRTKRDELEKSNLPDKELERLIRENKEKYRVREQDQHRFFHAGCFSTAQVKLRLSYFWLNHFTVGSKDTTPSLIGDYWGNTINKGLDGNFNDLLYYAVCHPAMVTYLDNIHNVGPNSPKNDDKDYGINDNLAREILELYTVSPSADYTEEDIRNCALILAGWGYIFDKKWRKEKGGRPKDFREPWYKRQAEPGKKKAFGVQFSSGSKSLRELTDYLAKQPSTIDHISRKLIRHFCGPNMPSESVNAVKSKWVETNGNLPEIHKTLLLHAVKSESKIFLWPQTWVFQALRMSKGQIVKGFKDFRNYDMYLGFHPSSEDMMEEMGQNFWSRRQPNGFSDVKDDWISTEHLDRRIRLAGLIVEYGKPKRTADEIISQFDISETTKSKLSIIKNSRAKFIATLCSMDIMEV